MDLEIYAAVAAVEFTVKFIILVIVLVVRNKRLQQREQIWAQNRANQRLDHSYSPENHAIPRSLMDRIIPPTIPGRHIAPQMTSHPPQEEQTCYGHQHQSPFLSRGEGVKY